MISYLWGSRHILAFLRFVIRGQERASPGEYRMKEQQGTRSESLWEGLWRGQLVDRLVVNGSGGRGLSSSGRGLVAQLSGRSGAAQPREGFLQPALNCGKGLV